MFFDEVNHSHSFEDLELEFSELESARTDQPISLEPVATPVVNNDIIHVHDDHNDHYAQVNNPEHVAEPQDAPELEILEHAEAVGAALAKVLRQSTRERKSALPEDYRRLILTLEKLQTPSLSSMPLRVIRVKTGKLQ